MQKFLNYLKKKDSAKVYLALGQVFFLGIGYLTQVILSKLLLSQVDFGSYQFINFLTNLLNLFIGLSIPIVLSKRISSVEGFNKTKELKASFIAIQIGGAFQYFLTIIILVFLDLILKINLSIIFLIILAAIQVFSYSLMNFTAMYILGLRKLKLFFIQYSSLGILKCIFILLTAILFKNVYIIIVGIILAQLLQALINYLVFRSSLPKDEENINWDLVLLYLRSIGDIIISNLLVFGITNLTVVLSYLGISHNFNDFNIYTLVFPWGLIPFYIVSSIGNIYIVDFASGKEKKENVLQILKRFFLMALGLSIASLIGASIFFAIFFKGELQIALTYFFLILPSSILIALISIVIAILQGSGELHKIRLTVISVIFIYIIISLFIKDLKTIILIGDLANLIFVLLLYLGYKNETKGN